MHEVVVQRASELYYLCDIEDKGYITKSELRRLVDEINLTPEQLDAVFDSLDEDKNGHLTLDEFTEGFGQFIVGDDGTNRDPSDEVDECSASWRSLAHTGIIASDDSIRYLMIQIKERDPKVTSSFDSLLEKLSHAVEKQHKKLRKLETTVRKKNNENEEKVKRLYNEMEAQIQQEGRKLMYEERKKEDALREQIESEISVKEYQYQAAKAKYENDIKRLDDLNASHILTEKERKELQETRNFLQESLYEALSILEEKKEKLDELRDKMYDDRKQRMTVTATLGKNIAKEQETLLNELTSLREMNKRLKDEKDEHLLSDATISFGFGVHKLGPKFGYCGGSDDEDLPELLNGGMSSARRGSHLGNYFTTEVPRKHLPLESEVLEEEFENENEIEVDDYTPTPTSLPYSNGLQDVEAISKSKEVCHAEVQTESLLKKPKTKPETPPRNMKAEDPIFVFGTCLPDSVYKVVLIGDVNVGKTSLIQRFVHQQFSESYQQTVGIDFQLRFLSLGERKMALQVWDTAGQERFRSISRQYYRKADGVCIVYDVTKEGSYLTVRQWINCIDEAIESNNNHSTVIMLLANKIDLVKDHPENASITTQRIEQMAEECGALFHEVSARTGENVEEAFLDLADILKEKEEEEIGHAIKLSEEFEKDSGCCLTSRWKKKK